LVNNRRSVPTRPLLGPPLEFRRYLRHRRTRVPGLSYGVVAWS